jgi:predicted GNAT family acetyltransferase
MAHEVRALDGRSIDQLRQIVERDPVRYCYVAARLATSHSGFFRNGYSDFLGYFDDGHLKSALLLGANVVPINTSSVARQEFAEILRRQGRRCSSIVGTQAEALDLWSLVSPSWGAARDIRDAQPVLAMSTRPLLEVDDEVRYATLSDLDSLFPACVDMFTQEVGVSPVANGGGPAYRNRISELITSRRAFVRTNNGEIVFKAEIGAIGNGVAQVQGVWVNPAFRGQGLAAPAMAAVVARTMDDIAATVSLYVNEFNAPAISTYKRVGFEAVDTFATVLF